MSPGGEPGFSGSPDAGRSLMSARPATGSDVVIGRVAGAFGIKGWVRLMSFTDPPENLVHYAPWRLDRGEGAGGAGPDAAVVTLAQWQWHGDRLIGRLEGVEDRNAASALTGADIVVPRAVLPAPEEGWYWADLLGAAVVNTADVALGKLADVMDNGAQDVMVLHDGDGRERLVPFVRDRIVKAVDVQRGRIVVDWEADY
jgi:16S rRNA processing protein RimM